MIGALITFLVLFGLIKIFEKSRDDLDNFGIATVAVIPVLIVIVVSVAIGFVYPSPILLLALPPLVLIGSTFGILWKHLDIPAGRSILYTVVVVIVNQAVAFALALT